MTGQTAEERVREIFREWRRGYGERIEWAIGKAMYRCDSFVEAKIHGIDGPVVRGPVGGDPTRFEVVTPTYEIRCVESADGLTVVSDPDSALEVYDLRPLSYADFRELDEAHRDGDTERVEELGASFEATSAAMVTGPTPDRRYREP